MRRIFISGRADIGDEFDFFAVERDCGFIFEFGVVGFEFFLFLNLFVVSGAFFFGRTNQDFAGFAVEDNGVAVSDMLNAVANADNGRDSARLRDDNGVRGGGADAEDNARDFVCGQTRDNGRLNVFARDDDFARDFGFFDAEEVFGNAFADVAHIDCTAAEVFVFHLFEDLRLGFVSVEDGFGSRAAYVDLFVNRAAHCGVFDHHAVRFEDAGLFVEFLRLEFVDTLFEVFGDCNECVSGFFLFGLFGARLVRHEEAVEVLTREQDVADCDTGDYAFALNFLCHKFLPPKVTQKGRRKKILTILPEIAITCKN